MNHGFSSLTCQESSDVRKVTELESYGFACVRVDDNTKVPAFICRADLIMKNCNEAFWDLVQHDL